MNARMDWVVHRPRIEIQRAPQKYESDQDVKYYTISPEDAVRVISANRNQKRPLCDSEEDEQCMARFLYEHGYATEPDKILDRGQRYRAIPISIADAGNDVIHINDTYTGHIRDPKRPLKCMPQMSMNWDDYQPLDVIYEFLDFMEIEYPSICSVIVIGKSLEGRDIKILKVSNSNVSNEAVWIDAGIHAREWIGPAVNTYMANYVVRNFRSLPESVTSKDWYFVPVLNPDGYVYTHTTVRLWRKNKAVVDGVCVGVDLNRNFSYGWGGKGSSDIPTNAFYRGRQPFSEPEAMAFRDFMVHSGVRFKVCITLHSFGEVIIFPFASQDNLCPNYIRLLHGATVMSKIELSSD